MRSPGPAFDLRAALSRELRGAANALDAGDKPKAIHQARVRLKRARALARVGHACAPGLSNVFNDSARAVMRTLAQVRDLAALAESARKTASRVRKREAKALEAIAADLDAERTAAGAPDLSAVRAGLRDLAALAQVWPECSARQTVRGANRIVRRAKQARRRAEGALDLDHRHEWRKREKDRLFAATLLGDAWPRRRRRKLGAKLGDVLGDERDALLLIEHMQATSAQADDKAAKRALRALERRRRVLAARADELGARLHARGD